MKGRLLYYYPNSSSFVSKDISIFGKEYDVRHASFLPARKFMLPFSFARQVAQLVRWGFTARCIVARFGGYHALLPMLFARIFGKPSLLIVGGTEAHYFPAIHYGSRTKKLYGWATGISLRLARHLAPVDESLMSYDYSYDPSYPQKQGLQNLYEGLHTPFTAIHNGYEEKLFHVDPNEFRRPRSFLTVANAGKGFEFYLKGIDLILSVSKKFPDCTFTIAGTPPAGVLQKDYPNVILAGAVNYARLKALYNQHEFYLQLSVAEGFPNALCEAMLCGCIPIGSAVFSIPKIIGTTGFVVIKRTVEQTAEILEEALGCDKAALSKAASQRIAVEYPLSKREEKILKLLQDLQG